MGGYRDTRLEPAGQRDGKTMEMEWIGSAPPAGFDLRLLSPGDRWQRCRQNTTKFGSGIAMLSGMKPKNPAAQALGRLGGLASAKRLTEKERKARAVEAALARWSGHVKKNLPKKSES